MTRFMWVKTFLKSCSVITSLYGKVATLLILLLCLFFLIATLFSFLGHKKLEVAFLNVGQGDATLITTPNGYQILIDGGRDLSVLGELKKYISYFDTSIDMVILTHADGDHLTGLLPVFEKFTIRHVVTSSYVSSSSLEEIFEEKVVEEKAVRYVVSSGDSFHVDGVTLYMLHPKKDTLTYTKDINNASVTFIMTYGEASFLFTGDLSSTYEPSLLVKQLPKKISVYKAGHHGSNTSSGELLLSYIRPTYTVVSAGEGNSYGHPHQEVIERLLKYNSHIFSTASSGSITVVTDGKSIDVQTEK